MKRVLATLIWLLAALAFLFLPILVGMAHGGDAVLLLSQRRDNPRDSWNGMGIVLGRDAKTGQALILTCGHFIRDGMDYRVCYGSQIPARALYWTDQDRAGGRRIDLGLLLAPLPVINGTVIDDSEEFHGSACLTHQDASGKRLTRTPCVVNGSHLNINVTAGSSGGPVVSTSAGDPKLVGIVWGFYGEAFPVGSRRINLLGHPTSGPGEITTAADIRKWLRHCGYAEEEAAPAATGSTPIENPQEPYTYVYVFTMPDCAPCDWFKRDVAADPEAFRGFKFIFQDVTKPGGNYLGLETVPWFKQTSGPMIQGYKGKQWLLSQLKKPKPLEAGPAVPYARNDRPQTEAVASVPLTPIPDPTVPPATKPGESPTPFADSAPVAPKPIPQPMQPTPPAHTQAPPAAAARTETGPLGAVVAAAETAWTLYSVAKWTAIIAGGGGIGGIAFGVGWKAATWAWGAMRSRRRREPQTAPSGGTRDSPYGGTPAAPPAGSGFELFPKVKIVPYRDNRVVGVMQEAVADFIQMRPEYGGVIKEFWEFFETKRDIQGVPRR